MKVFFALLSLSVPAILLTVAFGIGAFMAIAGAPIAFATFAFVGIGTLITINAIQSFTEECQA